MIDFPLNLRDDKENWTWFEGSLWLSLDRFERFWLDVGLQTYWTVANVQVVADGNTARMVIRRET